MKKNYELIDDEERYQYKFRIGRYIPRIEYIKNRDGVICLTHTEVPIELGDKGIGSQLVRKMLLDIEKRGLHLVPLCPFVAGYIQKHPNWKRIVVSGMHV